MVFLNIQVEIFEISIPQFEMNYKDKICISGESGQGKTTVLNILSDFYNIDSGTIISCYNKKSVIEN